MSNPVESPRNTNALENMRCPRCGSLEPFRIVATTWFRVFDDGADTLGDLEWDATSFCLCEACNHSGSVADFRLPSPVSP